MNQVIKEPEVVYYRKSRHFPEEPLRVDMTSLRASISAWKSDVDACIKKLNNGGKVSTPNFHFYSITK